MQEEFVSDEIEFDRITEENDFYTFDGLDSGIDDDCISPGEQGFMYGYLR